MKINKLLIANRGEIALRIMRTAKEMGIKTVAVFSEADRNALHTQYADEAVCIGPALSSESYLRMDKIINAAKLCRADAIHPGYGFLSENPDFAEKVLENNLIFIGPTPESMRWMGNKLTAKKLAKENKVPVLPGTDTKITSTEKCIEVAKTIGFPVLVKASAGGGGKGMRILYSEENAYKIIHSAMHEAKSSFGDDSVFIEKYLPAPRHIELQVLCDNFGNSVYLFERECSIQRRHQKLIEEAPSCLLTPEKRKEMGECAIRLAKACNYRNAGTLEFLMDENMNFYFMEMNTRLQVEHPVTELITGIDIVREQLTIAMGNPLRFNQDNLSINGHAIELRINAEDPENNFMPDSGKLSSYKIPQGVGIRVDDGFKENQEIPVYYDSMIGKLIVWGETREIAIQRILRAIDDFEITGINTTLLFGRWVFNHLDFKNGKINTKFIENNFNAGNLNGNLSEQEEIAGAVLAVCYWNHFKASSKISIQQEASRKNISNWKKNRIHHSSNFPNGASVTA
ncbi:MAG: acetyl-CoA carboxylase biotin carboxylase subunit [Bacteroidetes bacterium RIFCSPLOWO2_02_FULL_36_8]|nr:MAG: acetyl-CoA carboxylase biotin carboxylase subunit [Bacteroidetes bacterium RIFCSPLOWO2_02_FULL_36_8]OFY69024.1 MAG: acetyl-CoA carboxylase biotin carboxylase subunit [Bacteroidetes bacterium RIFCSPLOWO2_12_FULL_37_12]